jgi:SAM-dependent methyltransferase
LYGASYYGGHGADPLVDYRREMTDKNSIRLHEWRGISRVLTYLGDLKPGARWLDYGCGLGGMVRWGRGLGFDVVGYEEGYAAEQLQLAGLPRVSRSDLADLEETFDVVTAVEVIEHTIDPLDELRRICRLLRPGGLLFLTTGNAEPYERDLLKWRYVNPDVHVSYFQPLTLEIAYQLVGLQPLYMGHVPGWTDIMRYKVLKALHRQRRSIAEHAVPWGLLAWSLDFRLQLSAIPLARKP